MVVRAKKKTAKKKKVAKKKTTRKNILKEAAEEIENSPHVEKTDDSEYPEIKYKYGRPTKYQSKFCEYALHYLGQGYSKEALAGILCINKDTLYEWLKRHDEFSDAVTMGEAKSRRHWERLTVDYVVHTKNGKQINGQVYQLNMKNRFNYRDKQEIEVGEETRKSFAFDLDTKPEEIN